MGIKRTLLYEEVVEELYRLIDLGEVKPGNQFPSERELIQRLGISRNILREAFHVLEERGLIVSYQGKGRFLRELPEQEITTKHDSVTRNLERYSLVEIYTVRMNLESLACSLAAKNATEEDIKELDRFYQELKYRFERSNSTIGEFDMHRLYAKFSKNSFLEQMVDLSLKINLSFMTNHFLNVLMEHTISQSLKEHQEINEAIKEHDAERSGVLMQKHIQHTIDILNTIE